jgi:diguanylate cyclase (GGDEF)-like protein
MIGDELHCSQVYEWSGGAEPQQNNEHTVNVSYKNMMVGLEECLSSGRCVNGMVSEMSPERQTFLAGQGVLSILVVPVFANDLFWGFVGFDDCRKERIFTDNEEAILRSASRMIANFIIRNDMTKELDTALTDELTGARNRRYFMEAAKQELQRCIQDNLPYSLIMIDADYFKRVNDTYGHPVGDKVLKILVARIRNNLKQDTLVARYGGEEFIVSLPEISQEDVLSAAERIRSNIPNDSLNIDIDDLQLNVTQGALSCQADRQEQSRHL